MSFKCKQKLAEIFIKQTTVSKFGEYDSARLKLSAT